LKLGVIDSRQRFYNSQLFIQNFILRYVGL
jgi:hypothetical protein